MNTPWTRFLTALDLVARAPHLGGMVLTMRPGPAWDAALAAIEAAFPEIRRWPASLSLRDLSGGLDSVATLAEGRAVYSTGLLARGHPILIPSAERLDPQAAALIAQAMDAGTAPPLFLIDEAAEAEETLAPALLDRLPFWCDLSELSLRDLTGHAAAPDPGAPVQDPATTLTVSALRFGIPGLRAPTQALAAAHALNDMPTDTDVTMAAQLVLAPRATQLPAPEDEDSPQPEPQQQTSDDAEGQNRGQDIPLDDLVIEAVAAVLPDLLKNAPLKPNGARGGKGFSGSGSRRRGNRRGRPLPAQQGALDGQARIDLVATLRAAVPWQKMRRAQFPDRQGVILLPRDIHVQRMEERSDRVLVFTVDASGSSAMARLGEVKGAVELVLAQAYARRDHVALIAFRRDGAEMLLPPTRSLVQAKRRLASLPGGGGTPLAAGIEAGMRQAVSARARGLTPQVILLTDGRGNIAIDGSANRQQAADDAVRMARSIAQSDIDALVIDTGARPQRQLADLAHDMGAPYVPLPRARAGQISDILTGAR